MSLLQYTYFVFWFVWEHFEHDTGRRRFRFGFSSRITIGQCLFGHLRILCCTQSTSTFLNLVNVIRPDVHYSKDSGDEYRMIIAVHGSCSVTLWLFEVECTGTNCPFESYLRTRQGSGGNVLPPEEATPTALKHYTTIATHTKCS